MAQDLDKLEIGQYYTADFLKASGLIQSPAVNRLYEFVLEYTKTAADPGVKTWPTFNDQQDISPVYRVATRNGKAGSPDIGQGRFGLFRPASSDGKQSGQLNIVGDYSVNNADFYVEALEGERLGVRRAIVHIYVSTQDIEPGTYGNVDELDNGIQLFQRTGGVILNALDGLPIKKQEDWGRICYDALPVGPYGAQGKTPFFQVRLSFDKFVDPNYGIILEEGDRLGVRMRDNLPTAKILEHYVYFEGVHLATPSPEWANVIPEL